MGKTVIKMNLSVASIENALRQVELYREKVEKTVETLVRMMLDYGEDYAINNVKHIDTGETLASINASYRDDNKGIIVAGGHAVWIEFGTGVRKNPDKAPHPKRQEAGMSEIGTYGKGHGSNLNGWWYEDPDSPGTYIHTNGIKSNPFMWETAQFLRENISEFAKEAFHD